MSISKAPTVTIDLDSFDLSKEQGFGSGVALARFDIIQGGKRVTVHVDLFQHELRPDPTIRMTAVGPKKDRVLTLQVRPWTEIDPDRMP